MFKKRDQREDEYNHNFEEAFDSYDEENHSNDSIEKDSEQSPKTKEQDTSDVVEPVTENINTEATNSSEVELESKPLDEKNVVPSKGTLSEKQKKVRKISIISVAVIFLIGAGLVLYQPILNNLVAPKMLDSAVDEAFALESDDFKKNEDNMQKLVLNDKKKMDEYFGFEDVELLNTFKPSLTLQTKNVVGGIYIPDVNINLPILYGSNNANLNVGATTMKPTQTMGEGNYSLAGHNARNKSILFAGLKYLKIEKQPKVYITDKSKLYEYTLKYSKVVKPSKVEVIDDIEDKRIITLVTCNAWDGSDRLILQGELTAVTNYEEADKSIQKIFNKL
ncbi:hypothetical protein ABD87_22925 [Lysinibacillus sphaericus]|uniref:class A sortase n=1 Tax=Lysinibacillus sphaericus TaxID=1421 RepID=UPI0018CCBF62|nr:class A sortase [Lysinibacillus sphaericus]MBG9732282.1 hypothetical protein [Lysinibacillus sphaericus]